MISVVATVDRPATCALIVGEVADVRPELGILSDREELHRQRGKTCRLSRRVSHCCRPSVTTGLEGDHFHRRHRGPGPHPSNGRTASPPVRGAATEVRDALHSGVSMCDVVDVLTRALNAFNGHHSASTIASASASRRSASSSTMRMHGTATSKWTTLRDSHKRRSTSVRSAGALAGHVETYLQSELGSFTKPNQNRSMALTTVRNSSRSTGLVR